MSLRNYIENYCFSTFVYILDDFQSKDSFNWFKMVRFSYVNNNQSGDEDQKSINLVFFKIFVVKNFCLISKVQIQLT